MFSPLPSIDKLPSRRYVIKFLFDEKSKSPRSKVKLSNGCNKVMFDIEKSSYTV